MALRVTFRIRCVFEIQADAESLEMKVVAPCSEKMEDLQKSICLLDEVSKLLKRVITRRFSSHLSQEGLDLTDSLVLKKANPSSTRANYFPESGILGQSQH